MPHGENYTEDVRRSGTDRRGGDREVGRWLALAISIISLVTTIFLAGYYWRQVSDSAAILAKMPDTYQTKEVAGIEYRALTEQLGEMRKQIERLQASIDSRSRKE